MTKFSSEHPKVWKTAILKIPKFLLFRDNTIIQESRLIEKVRRDLRLMMQSVRFKVTLWVIVCFCITLGCGSNNSSGTSASKKPVAKQKTNAVKITEKLLLPPVKPGEGRITKDEIEALNRTYKDNDPQSDDYEVIPPSKPGERGVTKQEVDAARDSQTGPIGGILTPPPPPPSHQKPAEKQ